MEMEKRRAGQTLAKTNQPMKFSHAQRLLNAAIQVTRILGWAWRWAEWWIDYNSTWEPLLEPGQKESAMTKEELRIVDSTREGRCEDARKCRLAAFGAALRERAYDTGDGFDRESLDRALLAVLSTRSLAGPLEKYELDFLVDWLGRAYRSKSRLLGFGEDKICPHNGLFCAHIKDQTPKFILGERRLPGKQLLPPDKGFETCAPDVDDFLQTEVFVDAPARLISPRGRGRSPRKRTAAENDPTRSRSSKETPNRMPTGKRRGRPPKRNSEASTSGSSSMRAREPCDRTPTADARVASAESHRRQPIMQARARQSASVSRNEPNAPPKRSRGRPRKYPKVAAPSPPPANQTTPRRGRPSKTLGRPKKNNPPTEDPGVNSPLLTATATSEADTDRPAGVTESLDASTRCGFTSEERTDPEPVVSVTDGNPTHHAKSGRGRPPKKCGRPPKTCPPAAGVGVDSPSIEATTTTETRTNRSAGVLQQVAIVRSADGVTSKERSAPNPAVPGTDGDAPSSTRGDQQNVGKLGMDVSREGATSAGSDMEIPTVSGTATSAFAQMPRVGETHTKSTTQRTRKRFVEKLATSFNFGSATTSKRQRRGVARYHPGSHTETDEPDAPIAQSEPYSAPVQMDDCLPLSALARRGDASDGPVSPNKLFAEEAEADEDESPKKRARRSGKEEAVESLPRIV